MPLAVLYEGLRRVNSVCSLHLTPSSSLCVSVTDLLSGQLQQSGWGSVQEESPAARRQRRRRCLPALQKEL